MNRVTPIIRTKDNRFGTNGLRFTLVEDGWECGDADSRVNVSNEVLALLKKYSKKKLSEYPPGVVRLSSRKVNADNSVSSESQWLFSLTEGGDHFRIDTQNMMGVLCLAEGETSVRLEITSRFDVSDQQQFLNYLLRVGLGVDITGDVAGNRESGWEFLIAYLFMSQLGTVASVGLLRQYAEFRKNDFNPKGHIDVPRHIRENWPALHGVSYVERKQVFDVPLNHLLRHAAEKVIRRRPDILDHLEDARDVVKTLRENTPTWARDQVDYVLRQKECLTSVAHPYFAEFYEPLRVLARWILQDECVGLYGHDDTVCGVVFNGADLWEEYLGVLLTQLNTASSSYFGSGEYCHANNRRKSDPIHLYAPRQNGRVGRQRVYPDFRWRRKNGIIKDSDWDCILDAKYKGFIKDGEDGKEPCAPGVALKDRAEMAQYVMATRAKLCILMCPVAEGEGREVESSDKEWIEKSGDVQWYLDGVFAGYESKVIVVPLGIPTTNGDHKEYLTAMKAEEASFKKTIDEAVRAVFASTSGA